MNEPPRQHLRHSAGRHGFYSTLKTAMTSLPLAGLLLAAGFMLPAVAGAEEPGSYEARYSAYRNDKFVGENRVKLELDGDQWTMLSEARGTRGLARLLKLKDTEKSSGKLEEGNYLPSTYRHHTSAVGIERGWSAEFDWDAAIVRTEPDDGDFSLPLENGTLDPLSLDMALRRALPENVVEWQGRMVSEDEIKVHRYRISAPESLTTALGCLQAQRVERIRENSKRYTRVWYAIELGYVAVRLEHGKYDGDHMEMRIESLQLDGKTIEPGSICEHQP
jgi:hypothetical protein